MSAYTAAVLGRILSENNERIGTLQAENRRLEEIARQEAANPAKWSRVGGWSVPALLTPQPTTRGSGYREWRADKLSDAEAEREAWEMNELLKTSPTDDEQSAQTPTAGESPEADSSASASGHPQWIKLPAEDIRTVVDALDHFRDGFVIGSGHWAAITELYERLRAAATNKPPQQNKEHHDD